MIRAERGRQRQGGNDQDVCVLHGEPHSGFSVGISYGESGDDRSIEHPTGDRWTFAFPAARYGFLDVIPGGEQRSVRRATATIARLSDVGDER